MFGREPAMILGLVQAGLALAVGFGLDLSAEQVSLLMAFAAAIVAVITRAVVTPVT